jgi:PAS domain S-box-containing protein
MIDGQMIDSIGDSVVLISEERKIIYANRVARKVLGIDFDSIGIDEECCCNVLNMDICFGECPADTIRDDEDVVNNYPVKINGSDDSYCVSTSILRDDEGNRDGVIHTIKSMEVVDRLAGKGKTPRDELSRERRIIEVILDSIADGVFTVDEEGMISHLSKGMEEITCFRKDELLGKGYGELFRDNLCEGECPINSSIKEKREIEKSREVILTREGKPVSVVLNTSLLFQDGEYVGLVCTIQKVSELDIESEDLVQVEKRRILKALMDNNWKVIKAAESIGYSRITMWRRMKKFGIKLPNRS